MTGARIPSPGEEWHRKNSVEGVPIAQEGSAPNAYMEESVEAGPWIKAYCRSLVRYRWLCFGALLVIVGMSAPFAGKFPGACTTAFNPPPSSDAAKDRDILSLHFPNMSQSSDIVLYAERTDHHSPVLPSDSLHRFSNELRRVAPTWEPGMRQEKQGKGPFIISLSGYYSMRDLAGDAAAAQFLSSGNVSTFWDIRIATPMTSELATHFSDWLKDQVEDIKESSGCHDYEFTLLGAPAFIHVILASSSADLEHMDAIVLPLAVLILAWIVRSLRLMLMPLASLGISAAVSFAIMFGVAQVMNVFSGASALMMSILIAMSIDYGLFLLTRYREELERGTGTEVAVSRMLVSAGHTIVVSGLTLAVCFFGLVFLQNDFMVSVGLGCGIVLLCVLAFNLFVTPLLLLNFPNFFEKCLEPGVCCPPRCWCRDADERAYVKERCCCCPSGGGDEVRALPINDSEDKEEGAGIGQALLARGLHGAAPWHLDKQSLWYRFGDIAVRFPYNVIFVIVVVGAVLYCCTYATTYKVTNNNMYYLPRHSDVQEAYQRMGETFGFGQVWSYQVLLLPKEGAGAYDPNSQSDVWERSQNLLEALEKRVPSTGVGNLAGVLYAPQGAGANKTSTPVPKQIVSMCMGTPPPGFGQICNATMLAWHQFVNGNKDATWLRFTPPFAPMGVTGKDWLLDARRVAKGFPAEFGIQMHIVGQACDGVDAMDALYDDFPTMIGVTCAVVIVFVGLAFRSIFIPLRSVATIALTIFFVQGLAAMVYEHGVWDWTGFEGFESTGAVIYINPLLSFSIIVGVGLDYDIFLITRIAEYRRIFGRQFPDRSDYQNTQEAIKVGLTKTAGIITAAGVIMAIAFSGLLLSKEPIMNQLAFYMVFAVLFDTFIVRPVLVPSTMSLLYELNWWPCTFKKCGPCHSSRQTADDDYEDEVSHGA